MNNVWLIANMDTIIGNIDGASGKYGWDYMGIWMRSMEDGGVFPI